ncbi:HAD family hydrolase [Haloarchaeobius sp. TZWWS8]|uniref:HAD family hydrolase n=1 Tax=Haloarchaeobius sp. TZWWS8 TaxID=3446121 RepID=UPI003EBB0B9B
MPLAEYDYWLLDLDGTLVDVDWSYTRDVFTRVGDILGREFTDREAYLLWHGLTGNRDRQLEAWNIDPAEFWPAFHEIEDPQTRAEETYLHDDAAFVAELDCPVGLVTHCQQFLADPVIDHLDIRDWFDTIVCCTDETGWKPDPGPVYRALADLDIEPPQVAADGGRPRRGGRGVLAGDGSNDVGAAWNAGLDAIHVERHGYEKRGHCVMGDHRISSFDELRFDFGRRSASD